MQRQDGSSICQSKIATILLVQMKIANEIQIAHLEECVKDLQNVKYFVYITMIFIMLDCICFYGDCR
jgi:hypothetical protein